MSTTARLTKTAYGFDLRVDGITIELHGGYGLQASGAIEQAHPLAEERFQRAVKVIASAWEMQQALQAFERKATFSLAKINGHSLECEFADEIIAAREALEAAK